MTVTEVSLLPPTNPQFGFFSTGNNFLALSGQVVNPVPTKAHIIYAINTSGVTHFLQLFNRVTVPPALTAADYVLRIEANNNIEINLGPIFSIDFSIGLAIGISTTPLIFTPLVILSDWVSIHFTTF